MPSRYHDTTRRYKRSSPWNPRSRKARDLGAPGGVTGVQFVRPTLAIPTIGIRSRSTAGTCPAEKEQSPMKKIMLTLLFFTATAFAQSPFDGTWVSDVGAAQFSKKPHTFVLNKGMYTCSTCVPKISVKADGQDQA